MKILCISRTFRRPCIIITVFFLSFFPGLSGQQNQVDARSMALGTILSPDSFTNGPQVNPASLGRVETVHIRAAHSLPFLVKEIGISSLHTIIPVFPGTFRAGMSTYGLKGFRKYTYSLAYGMQLGDNIHAGINFNFQHVSTFNRGAYLWNLSVGGGAQYNISEQTSVGIILINPLQIENYPEYGEMYPAIVALGFSRVIYTNTLALTEIAFESRYGLQWKMGLSYRVLDNLLLRVGFHTNPPSISGGIGYTSGQVMLDLAFKWAALPGVSPAFSLSYKL